MTRHVRRAVDFFLFSCVRMPVLLKLSIGKIKRKFSSGVEEKAELSAYFPGDRCPRRKEQKGKMHGGAPGCPIAKKAVSAGKGVICPKFQERFELDNLLSFCENQNFRGFMRMRAECRNGRCRCGIRHDARFPVSGPAVPLPGSFSAVKNFMEMLWQTTISRIKSFIQ